MAKHKINWLDLPRVPIYLSQKCHCCGKTNKIVRMDFESVGIVCEKCYNHGVKCKIENCNKIVGHRTDGLCRDHYIGNNDDLYHSIDSLAIHQPIFTDYFDHMPDVEW